MEGPAFGIVLGVSFKISMMNTLQHNESRENSTEATRSSRAPDIDQSESWLDEDNTFLEGLYLEPIPQEDEVF
jgi:hypothetical protein